MQRNATNPSLFCTIKYLSQRLLSKPWTGFSGHGTERTETDDLLERMSLRELSDLPLGPEPRFLTQTSTGKCARLISQAPISEKHSPRFDGGTGSTFGGSP